MKLQLCETSKIDTLKVHYFDIENIPIGVVKNDAGDFFVFEAVCTHADVSLKDAPWNSQGNEIICPKHLARFNLQMNSVSRGPAFKPLTLFPSIVEDGILYCEVE